MFTEDQLRGNINTVDRQLLYDIRELIREQNGLLKAIVSSENKPETVDINNLKRPELMKLMSRKNPPQGWNKWGNDEIIQYLKGVSA